MKNKFLSKSVPRGTRTIWRYLGALFILFTFAIGNVWADTFTYNFEGESPLNDWTIVKGTSDYVVAIQPTGSTIASIADPESDYMYYSITSTSGGTKEITLTTKQSFENISNITLKETCTDNSKPTITIQIVDGDGKTLYTVLDKGKHSTSFGNPGTKKWSSDTSFDLGTATSGYVQIYLNSSSTNKQGGFDDIVITYTPSSGEDPVCPAGLAISGTAAYTEGQTISLTANKTAGNGEITYTWYKGADLATAKAAGALGTGATYTKSNCVTGDAGKYFCEATKTSCSGAASSGFDVTVEADPKCFNMPLITSKPDNLASVSVTGGTLTDANQASKAIEFDAKGLKFGGSAARLKVTLSSATIVENTKITVTYECTSDKGSGIAIYNGEYAHKTMNQSCSGKESGSWSHTFTAAEAANYADEFMIDRNSGGGTMIVRAITVEDCGPEVEKHTITLNYNDGVTPSGSLLVVDGKTATQPADPERGKYTFLGWNKGSSEYNWSSAVTEDFTLVAQWQDPWTITFDEDGGSSVADITVKHNTKATKPTDPTKENYEFDGWYYGNPETAFDWDANVTANYALKAHWLAVVAKYDIEYYDGETKIGTEAQVRVDQHPTAAGIETSKSLYHFDGWFLSSALTGDPVNLNTVTPSEGLKIYGKWTKTYGSSLDFAAVTTAGTTGSNPIATFLASGNMAATGLTESLWETSTGKSGFIGYKLKDAGAQIKFNLQAGKRAIITLGNVAAAVNINAGGAESVVAAAAGDDAETVVPAILASTEDILVTLTTTTKGTVTLKSILIEDIPALDNDATLKDLKVGGVTVAGFSAGTGTYYYEVPYGTEDFPVISATANSTKALQVAIQQAVWADAPYNCYRAQANVQAQDESWGYYDVRFYFAPKYGVELIKATHTGEHTADKAGYWKDDVTIDKFTQNGGKLGSADHYFGLTLGNEKTFKAGDLVVIKASNISSTVELFDTKTFASKADSLTYLNKGNFDSHSKMYTFTLTADADKLYLYRTKTANSQMNPTVDYIAVYRQMAPFIEEFKIGDAVGTIDKVNKTIAVEVPYSADLEHLTPAVKYWANGTAQISPAIGVTDFTDPVVFTVSSGYAEDATGAYAPVPYTVTVTKEAHYEAKIGETGYATLVAAVAAAQDGDEIVLQEDVTNGAGVMLTKTDAKVITIDFGGYTYTAVSPAVGSAGTQNQAFHLEKGNTVTLKNGTITSSGSEIKMLIQNYCDLTLENITLDGSGLEGSHRYVMSNNCGDVVIGNGTTITAKEGDVAFDVCATNYYPDGVTVTVKNGASITGIVEYDVWGTKPADNKAELAIEGGNFNITWNVEEALAEDAKENLNVSGGTFTAAVPADYCAEGYAPTSWTVGTETKYGVHLLGVIRAAAAQDANHGNAYAVTLDNGVVVISSNSDGKFDTNNQFDNGAADAAVALGADEGKYRYKGQHMLLKFPVNVNEFTIYSYDNNSTDRKINKVTVGTTPATEKLKNNDAIGTYTFTNNTTTKLRTMTATMTDDEIIASDKYVYIGLSNAHTVFRILFTEAPCIDPVINSTNATRAKVDETATVSVDATALGATYQWYRCEDALGTNPQIITGATAASYSFTKAAGDEYFKVVVGNNCNDVKVEAVVKAEVWTKLELADVTGNTSWSWAGVADGEVKINDVANKGLVLANYIDAPNFDKLEGHENARAYRSNDYPAYQGTSLKFHTTVAGAVIMDVRTGSGSFDLSVNGTVVGEITATRSIQAMYVGAGDVLISATDGEFRIYNMEFKLDNDLEPARTDEWLAPGELGTVCIPQGAVAVGADIYELVGKEPQYGKIVFESVEHMKPGKPYLFQAKGTRIDFILTDETPASEPDNENSAMKGTFVDLNLTELDNVYYFADHALWSCDDLTSLSVPANRAYVKMDEVQALQNPNAAPGRRRVVLGVHGEQVVTGVENLNASEQPIKLLINGQIFILRGEKLFDVTGKLVK